jgi:hypothetical protein
MFLKKELNDESYPPTHNHNPKNYIFDLWLESMWNKNLSNNNMILDLS